MIYTIHFKKRKTCTYLTSFFITGYLLFLTGFSFDNDVQTSAPDLEITWQYEGEIAKGENGIVSYPGDNRQFNHTGERSVANALILIPAIR